MVTRRALPCAVHPLGRANALVLPFRIGGELRVTVVLKGSFGLVHHGPMVRSDPAPIVVSDRHRDGDASKSLLAASDLVPYRPRACVTMHGAARGSLGESTQSLARLTLRRGQRVLIDKLAPGAAFGPLAEQSSGRGALLREPYPFGASVPALPRDFPWSFFEVAPPEQCLEFLCGDESLALENASAAVPQMHSQLPGVHGEARAYGPSTHMVSGLAVPLFADTLTIDAEQMAVSIVWRGSFAVDDEASLAAICVLAGIGSAAEPLPFPATLHDLRKAAPAPAPPPSSKGPPSSQGPRTLPARSLRARLPATPFEPVVVHEEPPDSSPHTIRLAGTDHAAAAARGAAIPFGETAPPALRAARPPPGATPFDRISELPSPHVRLAPPSTRSLQALAERQPIADRPPRPTLELSAQGEVPPEPARVDAPAVASNEPPLGLGGAFLRAKQRAGERS